MMRVSVKYTTPDVDVLEIGFYRGETLLHNVFYDIEGLDEAELLALKNEAAAKFAAVFPEISKKDIMKGFAAVDPLMQKLYQEAFNPRNAGRKTGVKIGKIKPETVSFHRRVTPEEYKFLDEKLKEFRKKRDN